MIFVSYAAAEEGSSVATSLFYFGLVERCTTAAHSGPAPVHRPLEPDLVLSRYFGSHFKQQPALTSIYSDRTVI